MFRQTASERVEERRQVFRWNLRQRDVLHPRPYAAIPSHPLDYCVVFELIEVLRYKTAYPHVIPPLVTPFLPYQALKTRQAKAVVNVFR